MFKIAFITDGHLKEKEKTFMKDKRKELLRNFVNVDMKKHQIDHLVYGGDMFDGVAVETSSDTAKFFFNEIVGTVSRSGKTQDLLIGNHEKRGKRNVYEIMNKDILSESISIRDVVSSKTFKDFNAIYVPYLYVSDYNTTDKALAEKMAYEQIESMAKELKTSNGLPVIVFNHNIMGGIWFEAEKEMDVKFYEIKDVDFVLGWHIHKKVDFNKGLYVGSFMRSFTYEEEDEGFYVLTISDNKQVSGEYIPVKSFDYEKVVVESDKMSEYVWESGKVYSVEFVFKNDNKDHFIVSNTLKLIEKSGAYVKGFKIRKSDDAKIIQKVISTSNSKEEILKAFLKRDSVEKSEYQSYLDKLEECSEKIAKRHDEKLAKDKKRAERTKNVEKKSMMTEKIAEYAWTLVNEDFAF